MKIGRSIIKILAGACLVIQPCTAQSSGLSYNEDNWKQFIKLYLDDESIKQETLCKTEKGRDVEMLRIGKGRLRIWQVSSIQSYADGECLCGPTQQFS